jgi:hypothetical protein
MTIKLIEIRDAGTFIPAMAIRVSGDDGYLMRRAGFGAPMVYLVTLSTERCAYDPYNWHGSRTMTIAHLAIEKKWDELNDGDVIDVEFELGETVAPKQSERYEVLS